MRQAYAAACVLWIAGCGTVELGDNFVPPDLSVDEDTFFCRIQPEVISATGCASGAAGEAGSCHTSRSSLRLDPAAETATRPACTGDVVDDPSTIPPSYEDNLEAVRFTIQSDPLSSPFYRRPLMLDSHPRKVFEEGSAEERLVFDWIAAGGR